MSMSRGMVHCKVTRGVTISINRGSAIGDLKLKTPVEAFFQTLSFSMWWEIVTVCRRWRCPDCIKIRCHLKCKRESSQIDSKLWDVTSYLKPFHATGPIWCQRYLGMLMIHRLLEVNLYRPIAWRKCQGTVKIHLTIFLSRTSLTVSNITHVVLP